MWSEDPLQKNLKGIFVQEGSSGTRFDHGQLKIKTFPIYAPPYWARYDYENPHGILLSLAALTIYLILTNYVNVTSDLIMSLFLETWTISDKKLKLKLFLEMYVWKFLSSLTAHNCQKWKSTFLIHVPIIEFTGKKQLV